MTLPDLRRLEATLTARIQDREKATKTKLFMDTVGSLLQKSLVICPALDHFEASDVPSGIHLIRLFLESQDEMFSSADFQSSMADTQDGNNKSISLTFTGEGGDEPPFWGVTSVFVLVPKALMI